VYFGKPSMSGVFCGQALASAKSPTSGYFSFCLFVCWAKLEPEKLYSVSCVERAVNPLGVITQGNRHKPRAYQRQRHIPRTCKSMINTLQVDGLARITGLSGCRATQRVILNSFLSLFFFLFFSFHLKKISVPR